TVANQTLTDPATSVTAGVLNARDDLAVSVMNADKYSPLTAQDLTSTGGQLVRLTESATDMLSGGAKAVLNAGTSAATTQVSQVSPKLASPAPAVSALSTTPKAAIATVTGTPDSGTASNGASSTNTGSTGTNSSGASTSSGTGNTGTSTSSSSSSGTVGKASGDSVGKGPRTKIGKALRDKAAAAKHDASSRTHDGSGAKHDASK